MRTVRQAIQSARSDIALLYRLVRRDMQARYMGSLLGLGWAIFHPLANIALYWLIFGLFLAGGRPGIGAGGSDYAEFLISGLLPWMGFQEAVTRGAGSILENGVILKRTPFKSQILIAVPTVTALVLQLIGLVLFCVILLVLGRSLTPWLILVPVAVMLQAFLQLGIALLLAPVATLYRDVQQLLGFALYASFFLSPVLYPVRAGWKALFAWNPMTPLVGLFRSALLGAPLPSVGSIVYLVIATVVVLTAGFWLTRRVGPYLVDIL